MVPGRAWKAISTCEGFRVPSIGVLYVHHSPDGCWLPATAFIVANSMSSAMVASPVSRRASIIRASQAMTQHVSIGALENGLPVACSPAEKPPVLRRSKRRRLAQ